MTTEEFLELKDKVDKLQRDLDRAKGAREQSKKRLAKEFNVTDAKQAKAEVAKLQKELEELEEGFDKEMKEFENAYESRL